MGDLRRHANSGFGDAHARSHRTISRDQCALLFPRRRSRVAALRPRDAQPDHARRRPGDGARRRLTGCGMATAIAFVALVSLNAYVLLAGADFGGGVWDLLASGPRRAEQRALIAEAIGPIWEANHVWLILVVVLLFTCFPAVFSGLAIALHIPLTLMLVGIVLRGSAFAFRSYGSSDDAPQRRWGRVFAIASVLTPLVLGICIGAIASGRVGDMLDRLPQRGATESFVSLYVTPWLSPFTVAVGALALALFAFLAATYLTVEAENAELREDFRRRALWAAAAVFVTAFLALILAWSHAPRMSAGLIASQWALPLHILTGIVAIVAIVALWV